MTTKNLLDRFKAAAIRRADIAARWYKLKAPDEQATFVVDHPDIAAALEADPQIKEEIMLDIIRRIIEPGADLGACRKEFGDELVDKTLAARERWMSEAGKADD